MRVKYVKSGPSGKIGQVKEHTAMQARVLIKMGIAEPVGNAEPPTQSRTGSNQAFGQLPKVSADNNANPILDEKKGDETPARKRGRPAKVQP